MFILESLGALGGQLVHPSAALAASGEADARGRGAGGSWAGWGQAHSHLQSQNRRAAWRNHGWWEVPSKTNST